MPHDVTILGAGAVGLCTALSLAERGQKVCLIDRGEPGQETTFGNAGVISPWSFIPQAVPGVWRQLPQLMLGKGRPLSVRMGCWPKILPWGLAFLRQATEKRMRQTANAMEHLCAPSVDLYRRHLAGTGAEQLVRDSLYVHAFRNASQASLDALAYKIRQEKGARIELVGGDDLRQLEPALSENFGAAILIHGQARALAPGRIASVLADKARGMGVHIIQQDIRGLHREGENWRVQYGEESHLVGQVIIALGAWSADFLRPLGLRVPLAIERGYHLDFPDPDLSLTNSVSDVGSKFVASSMESGLRVAGFAEFADLDAPPNEKNKSRLLELAQAAFPALKTSKANFWMGRRPSFPDSLPMIGPFKDQPGLYAGFGHSHYGLMMAPKTGEILADLLTQRMPNVELSTYSTDRFSRGPVPFQMRRS